MSNLMCCVCLLLRYEKAVIAMAKQSVTLEVLSYHASASLEDAQRLRVGMLLAICLPISCNFLNVYYPFFANRI